jgi:transposase
MKQILDDKLWEEIQPLLPKHKRRFRFPGRKPIDDRNVLIGILYVLMTGIPWEMLPPQMGCGSGITCWRRLRDWQKKGVWQRLHNLLLDKLGYADKIDWSRAIVDSTLIRAVGAGEKKWSQPYGPSEARKQATYNNRRKRRALGIHFYGRPGARYHATFESRR